jgi:hypothetical protein
MKNKKNIASTYWLLGTLLLAALLRLQQIDQPFIDATSWRQTDTATIADNFYQGHWNIFFPKISWNGPGDNYVGYEFQTVTYIAALLYRLLGHHDWVGRAIAVVFGVWGVFAFYQLLRWVWSEKHAQVGALLLAILPGAVYVDRSFLPDPVMLSLVITGAWLLVSYLQTEKLDIVILASLFSLLGFLTKVSGLLVGLPMLYAILTTLYRTRKFRSKQVVLLAGMSCLILIPVFYYYRWAIHISHTYPPYYIAAGQYWVWIYGLQHFLQQHYFLPKLFTQLQWFWTVPFLLLTLVGVCCRPFQAAQSSKIPWFFHVWMAAFALYYLIAAQGLVNNPTNLNLANPAAAALSANLLLHIDAQIRRIANPPMAIALLTAMFCLIVGLGHQSLKDFAFRPWAENDYQLGLALRQISQPHELVVTATSPAGATVAIYYSQRRGWTFPPVGTEITSRPGDDRQAIRLLQDFARSGMIWLGMVDRERQRLSQTHPQLIQYIDKNSKQTHSTPEFIIYRLFSLPQP